MKKKLIIILSITIIIYLLYNFVYLSSYFTFPFSKSNTIEIVFYEKELTGGADLKKINEIPSKKKVILDNDQKNELFKILYKEICIVEFSAACYDPRHAIIFKAQKDTIGVIEICLECAGIRETSDIKKIKMCDSRIEKLDAFFKKL